MHLDDFALHLSKAILGQLEINESVKRMDKRLSDPDWERVERGQISTSWTTGRPPLMCGCP